MRHEKKYRLEDCTLGEVKQVLLHHPLSFATAYSERWINSMYFDSEDLTSFDQNQAGISNRTKYRVRWYGDDMLTAGKPSLELKIKDNQFGKKEITSLADFSLLDEAQILNSIKGHVPGELSPMVLTRYKRLYYVSQDQRLRATIDTEVAYYGFNGYVFKAMPHFDPAIILELKCEKEEVDMLAEANQHIPFRITKNSKYVNGVLALMLV